jgi:outer membrane receptor protein involved in Fe transport
LIAQTIKGIGKENEEFLLKKINKRALVVAVSAVLLNSTNLLGADLNTQIPMEQDKTFMVQVTLDIPSQQLASALDKLGKVANMNIAFPTDLVLGKQSSAVKGTMTRKEALSRLLANTGLDAKIEGTAVYIQKASNKDENIQLDKIQVRAKRFYEIGPMPGLALTKEEIPGNVQSITAKEIKESHALSLTDLMNSKLQSVNVNDYQSNPFQMDVQYRGFTASPQLGTAQGISVFLDGIRVNEPFGDVVNWDMIPMNALSGLDVFPGSNPMFGLGTLGGALAMRTKSGFNDPGFDMEVLGGSFGRKQLQVSAGSNNGVIAGFAAGTFFMEDGWRDNSPSKVNQVFGKAEWQNEHARLGLSMLYAGNKLTGNGLLPEQMVDQNPKQVYTSPDESKNDLLQFQLSGVWDVSDTFNITGQIYNRKSKRKSHTSDVNENFGGTDRYTATASTKDRTRQLLPGLQDINRDGLPDYNDYAYNVAADASGRALDINGIADGDPSFDINNLAYGTNFNTQANANQVQVTAADGSGNLVWSWTVDPRRNLDDLNLPSNIPNAFNAPVSDADFANLVRFTWDNRAAAFVTANTFLIDRGFLPSSTTPHPGTGNNSYGYDLVGGAGLSGGTFGGYTDNNGFFHDYFELVGPVNPGNYPIFCTNSGSANNVGQPCILDVNGKPIFRDGKFSNINDGSGVPFQATGYIEGTPTAIFNDTEIGQDGKGAALQLNWNLDKHKFMVGASYDTSDSTYVSKQYLGFLDANRHGYTAPDQLGWEYFANSKENGFGLNDFKGDNTTKSLYFSETWTPVKTLNITAAARYNHTVVNNQLAVSRLGNFGDVNRIVNLLNALTLCTDNDNNGTVEASECPTGLDGYIVPFDPSFGYLREDGNSILGMDPGLKEKFKYRSFNPSLGVTWQARDDLNLYGNLSRGARTPTTIELGCAFDDSPVFDKFDPVTGEPIYVPRTFLERRNCNLPGAMSGDPYLKQVRSKSLEFGARGNLTEDLEWNASVYRTDLTDDIYFVSVNATQSYFQNIGNTRRQGLEMGLKGKVGKTSFGINYGLTDATFQSAFTLASPYNSSAGNVYDLNYNKEGTYGQIKVKPGNRMPGVPLHNLNFNVGYEITDKWNVGLNMIMHSKAFVRGNENNKHKAGPASPLIPIQCITNDPGVYACQLNRADWREGKTAGYSVFNFQTSYKLAPEWTMGLQINNLFDKQYASAGRLGLNAFSPATLGVVGESGFNYNSSEWQGTSFLGTGAPRSAFFTLSYQFVPKPL